MKKYISLILFGIMLPVFASAEVALRLVLNTQEVKQGAMVSGRLEGDPGQLTAVPLQKLKNFNMQDMLYFYEVGPLMHEEGQPTLSVPVGVIFLAKPKGQVIQVEVDSTKIRLDLGSVQVTDTEIPSELIFGTFNIPSRSKTLLWLAGITLVLLVTAPLGFKRYRKWQIKKNHMELLRMLRAEIESANTYDEVVEIWKKKRTYIENFPLLDGPFQKLEQVLFQYQFKPVQTEEERSKVLSSYQEFKSAISGGLNGV